MMRLMLVTFYLICSLLNGALAQETDAPFARLELFGKEVPVGKPARLVVTLMVPTNFRIPPEFPDYDGLNAIVRSNGPDMMPVTEYRNGKKWTGASQTYWIYPMKAGEFVFRPAEANGTYTDPVEVTAKSTAFAIEGFTISAVVPDGAENLQPLIVAENVTLDQTWDGPLGGMKEGDAITRTVVATIEGSPALFLPALIPDLTSDLLKSYPQPTEVSDSTPGQSISGTRTESTTYVAQYGGDLFFPEISLRWFNSNTGEIEVATASHLDMTIDAPDPSIPALVSKKQAVILLSLALLVVTMIRVYVKWLQPFVIEALNTLQMRWFRSEAYAARKVEAAIQSRDLHAVYQSVVHWSQHGPAIDPNSQSAFVKSLTQIGNVKFGSGSEENWSDLMMTFRKMRKLSRTSDNAASKTLPKLNPFS